MEAAQFPVVAMPPPKRSTLPKLHLVYQEEKEPPGYQAHPRPWCTKAYDFSPRQCLPLFDSAAHLVADLAMKLVMGFFRSSTSSRKEGNKRKVRMNATPRVRCSAPQRPRRRAQTRHRPRHVLSCHHCLRRRSQRPPPCDMRGAGGGAAEGSLQ
jgi:hypothetical protein